MRFGTRVRVRRGSAGRSEGKPGCLRWVVGTLIGRRGVNCQVRLEQDDPQATCSYCTHAGDVGSWPRSVVVPDVECKGYRDYWGEFNCDYEHAGKFECDDCLVNGGRYDPRTGKKRKTKGIENNG